MGQSEMQLSGHRNTGHSEGRRHLTTFVERLELRPALLLREVICRCANNGERAPMPLDGGIEWVDRCPLFWVDT